MSAPLRPSLFRLAAGLCLAGGTACAPTQPLEGADLPALQALTEEIQPERVWGDLLTLTRKHATDQSIDCVPFVPASTRETWPELCHLSNSLSGAWVREQFVSIDGLRITDDVSFGENGMRTHNIVAELEGTTRPGEHGIDIFVRHAAQRKRS